MKPSVSTYFIKSGYRFNINPAQYTDTEDDALTYQVEVYRFAAGLAETTTHCSVLDVGCGLGLKLRDFIVPTGAVITGVDRKISIDYCLQHHGFGRWLVDDIEKPVADLGNPFDIILCSDVIEHLVEPDKLFSYLHRWSHEKTKIILSTPERDLRRGPSDMGPPGNPAHVREWNREEFRKYIGSQQLLIEDHRIVDLKAGIRTCQLACCSWDDTVRFTGQVREQHESEDSSRSGKRNL